MPSSTQRAVPQEFTGYQTFVVALLAARIGKYPVFFAGTLASVAMVIWYTRLGVTPLSAVVFINILLFIAVNARMVSASALASGVPELRDRGAYMSVNSSLQQISGGVAAWLAGLIVVQSNPHVPLQNYPLLGMVVATAMLITLPLMWNVNRMVLDTPVAIPPFPLGTVSQRRILESSSVTSDPAPRHQPT